MAQGDTTVYQWIIIRENLELFVWWEETKEDALAEFHRRGYKDEWRVLRKGKMTAGAVKP